MRILGEYRLDRAATVIEVADRPGKIESYFLEKGLVRLGIGEASIENFRKYPYVWKAVILHEFGHSLDYLEWYLTEASLIKHRAGINRILDYFQPQRSLEAFFKPKGEFIPIQHKEPTLESINELYKHVSEVSVTSYPLLVKYDYGNFLTGIFFRKLQEVSGKELPGWDEILIDRLLPEDGGLEIENLDSYFQIVEERLKRDSSSVTELEKMVFDEIRENIELFKAPKRIFVSSARRYFEDVVVPVVFMDLFRKDPKLIEETILASMPGWEPKRLKHLIHKLKLELKYRRYYQEGELFAEIFQSSLRRHDSGVVNEIPEEIWMEVDKVISSMMDDLIMEGLAEKRSLQRAVV